MTSLNDDPGLYNSGHVRITNEFSLKDFENHQFTT